MIIATSISVVICMVQTILNSWIVLDRLHIGRFDHIEKREGVQRDLCCVSHDTLLMCSRDFDVIHHDQVRTAESFLLEMEAVVLHHLETLVRKRRSIVTWIEGWNEIAGRYPLPKSPLIEQIPDGPRDAESAGRDRFVG